MNLDVKKRLIETALQRLDLGQLRRLHSLTQEMLKGGRSYAIYEQLLSPIKEPSADSSYKTVALVACSLSRAIAVSDSPMQDIAPFKELVWLKETIASSLSRLGDENSGNGEFLPATAVDEQHSQAEQDFETTGIIKLYEAVLGRTPVQKEIDYWKGNLQKHLSFSEFVVRLSDADEAVAYRRSMNILPEESDERFIQFAHEIFYGRGCSARDIVYWEEKLKQTRRRDVVAELFSESVKAQQDVQSKTSSHDPLSSHIMGTQRVVSINDWRKKSSELEKAEPAEPDGRYACRFSIKSEPRFLVTAIASLYKGKDFIERFMDNIVSQSCFKDYCELVIVDADSPDGEYDVIKRYLSTHKGINYIRTNYPIGIYDAWNVGVRASRGEYLTNTNVDDLRRQDSLELQAGVLDNLPFVDIVYQDFYYSFEPRIPFEKIAAFGYESNLPVVTPHNMMEFNSPHNAPMWRKRLHHELGYFDTTFKSAGDYEFWMRCLAGGKVFYKLNDPHITYYQNPDGISTGPNTRGIAEAKEISRMYARKLISDNLVMPFEQFCEKQLCHLNPHEVPSRNRYTAAQRALRNTARILKYPAR